MRRLPAQSPPRRDLLLECGRQLRLLQPLLLEPAAREAGGRERDNGLPALRRARAARQGRALVIDLMVV